MNTPSSNSSPNPGRGLVIAVIVGTCLFVLTLTAGIISNSLTSPISATSLPATDNTPSTAVSAPPISKPDWPLPETATPPPRVGISGTISVPVEVTPPRPRIELGDAVRLPRNP